MNIFISGIGGVGMGALAQVVHDAGHTVLGSDQNESLMSRQLTQNGINVVYGQSAELVEAEHKVNSIDWFVYTAALPADHPELLKAKELGIRISKRDELLSHIIAEKNLKLIAISGTHGKTTTTGMFVWALKQLNIPVSYAIGTTLGFGPSGQYDLNSEYFVYECDEFDRNFLNFSPYLSLVTSIGYDHSDTYPTKDDYRQAFGQFLGKSSHVIGWQHDFKAIADLPSDGTWQLKDDEVATLKLAGEHNRRNATLVLKGLEYIGLEHTPMVLETFPGTNRRFEKLADNLYSDYGHHPTEIAATLQMARELSDNVVLVYQPHQNIRQHEIKNLYRNVFSDAKKIYWLPTYLSREDLSLPILKPEDLTTDISNKQLITFAQMDAELWARLEIHQDNGDLVLCMGAGSVDSWVRNELNATTL